MNTIKVGPVPLPLPPINTSELVVTGVALVAAYFTLERFGIDWRVDLPYFALGFVLTVVSAYAGAYCGRLLNKIIDGIFTKSPPTIETPQAAT